MQALSVVQRYAQSPKEGEALMPELALEHVLNGRCSCWSGWLRSVNSGTEVRAVAQKRVSTVARTRVGTCTEQKQQLPVALNERMVEGAGEEKGGVGSIEKVAQQWRGEIPRRWIMWGL